ncbi:hypothetical protein [Pantoea sp. B65]|uniref:hypothetical protein n=1 Tax=Pantoea sp. B65 TaxID=2813359 RepID=UPI0039B518BD
MDGAVKEFLSATGAANGSGRVVHIQNADGQHYEALLQRNVGAQSFKQPTTKQPEKNAKSSQPRAAATSAQSTVVAAKHGRAAPLTLTAKQKEAINRCEVDFSLVLSCITTLPVIRQTAGESDTVFASGIAVTKHRPVDSVSEAIILSRQGEEWVVRLREAGKTTRLRAISQPMLPAGILEKLPQNLLAVTDASAICAMFAPETIIYIKTGLDRYIAFFKVAHTQSSLAARQKCAEIAVEFQALPHGSSIVRRSFFQAAIDHLIKQPAEICNIIPIIIDNLGCPAPEMLKIITASMAGTFRSDPGQIIRTSAYLYYLAKRLPADQSAMLDEAVKQMLAALLHRDGPISPHNLFKEIGKTIYADLWQQPIENEITKKEVMFYYTRFITAIQQSEFSQIEQYCASEALWPLAIISCTDDELVKLYWPKYRAEMNSFTLHINGPEEKDKLGIDDRLLCMLINNIYSAPEIWAPYAISRFYKFIAAAGEDGNMPLATLSLIEAANMIISPPYARQLLNNIFKKNLKGANIIRGMTILMTNTLFSEESRAEIYKNTDENAIDIFVKHWIQYKNLGLPTNRISKGQCLALDNNSLVVINEQDVSKVNGRKLFTREANQTLMQYDILERMVFSSDEYLPLFREILLSLPKIKNKTAVMVKIIDANMQGDSNRKDRIHELNMRLQRIVENVVPALKKQRDITLWQPLVENILSIQIMLLGLISGDGAVKLSENVSHNLASIESSDSMTTPLIILQRKIKKDHLKKELVIKEMARNKRRGNALPVGEPGIKEVYIEDVVYLDIISRAVEKSCVNNPNADGQYLRTMIFNNAQYILENIDKLFISVAQISTNLSCTLSGFEAFVNIAIREMEIPPQIRASSIASKPAGALNKIQLEAFSSFIRSKPIAWDIIDKAYTAKAGSPVNIDWIINPESFLSASPEVQVLMLNFILARLPNDTRGYLHRYLAAISSRIASEAKEVILLENTLIRICNFLQSKYMTSFAELIEPILSLSQSLKGKKQMLAVSSPLKNSLKSMLNAVQEANPAQYTTLSEQYKELLAPDTPETTQQPGPLFFQDSTSRNASSSESSWRSDSRSTSNSNSSKPTKRRNTTGTDSTSESKSLHNIQPSQKTKTITAPTLYVGNNWAELNATADQSQALQQALRLMLSDSRAHELRLHKYKHSAMLSIDIKPRDIQDITASWEGRSDCRGMLLKGSNNRYLLLKVGTHAQAIAEAKNYQKASKPMVDAMIDNLSAQYQKLDLNPATGQLEMVEHDAAAGHG